MKFQRAVEKDRENRKSRKEDIKNVRRNKIQTKELTQKEQNRERQKRENEKNEKENWG